MIDRSMNDALKLIEEQRPVLFLDHDLGEGKTAKSFHTDTTS